MTQLQWVLLFALLLGLLLVTISNRCFGDGILTREKAILNIITPQKKAVSKLPYTSKRIKAYRDPEYRKKLVAAFELAGRVFGLSPNLLIALGYRETVFRPELTGGKGERGILQTMPRVSKTKACKRYCVDLDTPEGGALCGACWFKRGLISCGDYRGAISAYVSGRCDPVSRKVKLAVNNRMWLWAHLNELTGEEQ